MDSDLGAPLSAKFGLRQREDPHNYCATESQELTSRHWLDLDTPDTALKVSGQVQS